MWHFQKDGTAKGPFNDTQIGDLISSGDVTPQTLVWTEGMEYWSAAQNTKLANRFRQVPPPVTKVAPQPAVAAAAAAPAGFKNPKPIGNWLTALLVLYLIAVVFALWSGVQQLDLLDRISRGHFTKAEVSASDARERLTSLTQLALFLITAIFFCRWTYVVARNARALGAQKLDITPGWAVGYYFIPVVTLWKPYQAIREVWKASRNPAQWQREKNSEVVRLWWALWISSCLVGQVALRATFNAKKVGDYIQAATYNIISDGLDVLLCVAAIVLVQSLSSRQVTTSRISPNQSLQPTAGRSDV